MIHLENDAVRASLAWPELTAAIERAVAAGVAASPRRAIYDLTARDGAAGHLLIMPAMTADEIMGLKIVTYWPGRDPAVGPALGASYALINQRSGEVLATLAAEELTARRTAAVSVVAAKRLMRSDARRLLVIGTGPVSRNLVLAYADAHRFDRIELYGRDAAKADEAIAALAAEGVGCVRCDDLERSVAQADVISSATSATRPVIRGEWVAPGTHIDLVGGFTPQMREVDDALVARATSVWLDTDIAMVEAGDICGPLANGRLDPALIRGDLQSLLCGDFVREDDDITVFKSVGFAIPDLAAAELAFGRRSAMNVSRS